MFLFETLSCPLATALADLARASGHKVIDAASHGGIEAALATFGAPRALVLTPPARCETHALRQALADTDLINSFAAETESEVMGFLRVCRAVTQAMMPQKDGQVLFLGIDDVAARLIGLPETPMGNQFRISALKSLAKEYGRMGIRYNAVISQPSRESVLPEIWRDRREALKVYTMRFSPVATAEYAAFCWSLLANDVPVNGGVLCLGKGVMEMAA